LPTDQQVNATTETLYDLASNTKMYAGMFAIQKLLYDKKIKSLDDPISKYIPNFTKEQFNVFNSLTKKTQTVQWGTITIRQILTHTSGFIPDPRVFLTGGTDDVFLLRDKNQALEKILMLDLQTVPGTKQLYSDVDFMLVDILVHAITNK
jgi:CubicO group peptidase (beta-lactamase class C family)